MTDAPNEFERPTASRDEGGGHVDEYDATPGNAGGLEDPGAPGDSGESEEPDRDSLLYFIKDNLEAFAVAVVMALVIKHFCVEAFKIPTGSMVPTLIGDKNDPDGNGDRILVDKWAYLLQTPDRWDIPVFRYPLDRSRNFIKRIVGLPGEHLRIHDGDIWIKAPGADRFLLARKSERVRNQLYFAVYPPADADAEREADDDESLAKALDDAWRRDGPEGAWNLRRHDRYEFAGGARASLVTRYAIHRGSNNWRWPPNSHYSETPVRDVRVRARIERGPPPPATLDGAEATARVEFVWSPDGLWEALLSISDHGSHAELRQDGRRVKHLPLDLTLAPKSAVDLTLEYVDGDLRVSIDGTERGVLSDDRSIDERAPASGKQSLTLSAEGAPFVIADLRIDRDLYYGNEFTYRSDWQRAGVVIPEGAYFMLGDNTTDSSDSRRWRIRTLYLRDGTAIRYDDGPGDGPSYIDGDRKRVVDVEGVERTWHEDDEDPDRGSTAQNAPFVWRELIVGRAFLVFWPVVPEFPGRLRFIH